MPDFFYIYPAYLERATSRGLGRRIPAAAATDEVTAEKILAAARALGYRAEAEADKQYPRQFHTYAGRVKVAKKPGVSKTRALREIAAAVRSGAGEAEGA